MRARRPSIIASVLAALPAVFLALPAAAEVLAPPAGAIVLDFEDAMDAPAFFVQTRALRDRYAPLGVLFTAPGKNGGAVLLDQTDFEVTGYSGHHFLAYNRPVLLSDSGIPELPQGLEFRRPVRHLQLNFGATEGGDVLLEAFDAGGQVVASATAAATPAVQTLVVAAPGIVRAQLSYAGDLAVVDDVAFVPDAVVVDFDDGAAAPADFAAAKALRDRYAARGVAMAGPGNDGGAVLAGAASLGITGASGPNVLAFDSAATLSDGGKPQLPQELLFAPPVRLVSIRVATAVEGGAAVTATAFDHDGATLGEATIQADSAMKPLQVAAPSITRVVLSSEAASLVADDLAFEADARRVDFDDVKLAAISFDEAEPLADRYGLVGVLFEGAEEGDGPGILDQEAGFGVTGTSAPNVLAFDEAESYLGGGKPVLPATLRFAWPMQRVEFRAGSRVAGRIDVEAFDVLDRSVGTASLDLAKKLQSVVVRGQGILRLEVTTNADEGVIDDLAFQVEPECSHPICLFGTALDEGCDPCVTKVCAADPACCSGAWDSDCARAVDTTCETTCPVLCGDANDDRRLTAADALAALRTAVGTASCADERCDYNGDGSVKSGDALGILKAAVGLASTPACPFGS